MPLSSSLSLPLSALHLTYLSLTFVLPFSLFVLSDSLFTTDSIHLSHIVSFLLSVSLCFRFSSGWFKLLPTFGGCVITVSKVKLLPEGILDLEVDYTTAKQVEGLNGLGTFRIDYLYRIRM